MMDHRYIEEHHIVDRFLMGRLDAAEAERFQDHSMSCAECLDNLALAEKLQRGMRDAFAGDVGRVAPGPSMRRPAWYAQGWLAAAAVVVLAVTAGMLVSRLNRANTVLDDMRHRLAERESQLARMEQHLAASAQPRANVPLYRMSPERALVQPDREPSWLIPVPEEPQWLVLVLNTAMPGGGPFEGRIFKSEKETLWQGTGLLADHAGDVTVGLRSDQLPPGDYHLVLTQHQEGRPSVTVARFYFRVTDADL